jgi:hypothetical protein
MKKLIALLIASISYVSSACWYRYYNYEDYIYGINNFDRFASIEFVTESGKQSSKYTVKNNMVVDLPLSVSMKLVSNSNVNGAAKPEIKYCALQYRVLPYGEWVTVAEHQFSTGNIEFDELPKFYLGKNNINPLNCKKDDVIMIRLYVTDGVWQSGELDSLCTEHLKTNWDGNKRKDLLTLQDTYSYTLKEQDNNLYDLGGNWLPHFVTTVIFSGNYRPIR